MQRSGNISMCFTRDYYPEGHRGGMIAEFYINMMQDALPEIYELAQHYSPGPYSPLSP